MKFLALLTSVLCRMQDLDKIISTEKGIKTSILLFQLGRACDISVLLQTFVSQKLYIE